MNAVGTVQQKGIPALAIAEALTGDEDAWAEEGGKGSGEVLGDYGWEPNTYDDGFVPDNGWIWMATKASSGRRIVLWAVLDNGVCFIAESQTGGSPWTLEKQWGRTGWGRPRMPRTADQFEKLTGEVIAWTELKLTPICDYIAIQSAACVVRASLKQRFLRSGWHRDCSNSLG